MPNTVLPIPGSAVGPTTSNRIVQSSTGSGLLASVGWFRLPTDALFYADLVLQNVIANSRYRVTRNDTGAELATGTGGGDITISGVPCYDNPMLVKIMIRNASGATKYKPFEASAYIYKTGGAAYILQIED